MKSKSKKVVARKSKSSRQSSRVKTPAAKKLPQGVDLNYADITVVLDRSGSMSPHQQDTIGGFNHFLSDQRKAPGRATFTLIQFDHEYRVDHDGVDIKAAVPLTAKTYQPRGTTALLDAVGRAIKSTEERIGKMADGKRPAKVVFVIVTDGEENSSREYTRKQIFELVQKHIDDDKWDFLYLGEAGLDAFAEAGSMGIPQAAAANYVGTSKGIGNTYKISSQNILRSRASAAGGQCCACDFSAADRSELMGDDDQSQGNWSDKDRHQWDGGWDKKAKSKSKGK